MGIEASRTRVFCDLLQSRGCYTRALAGSMLQVGIPDRYILTPTGRHLWVEMKQWKRLKPPETIDWLPLFGSRSRARQDEFVREVCERDPDGARVVVAHESKMLWVMYRPGERPGYVREVVGLDEILEWILKPWSDPDVRNCAHSVTLRRV